MIEVFADWTMDAAPKRLGSLRARRARTGQLFDFAFDENELSDPVLSKQKLDPDIDVFRGPQFPKNGRTLFGFFKDSSPDRWGETLIARRFDRDKRAGLVAPDTRLTESDYLLGVHDAFRSGALRYKETLDGPFLDNRHGTATPPFVRVRELEAASRALESDTGNDDAATDQWLRLLLAPGASLGGARPKATVVDPDGHLWVAKFPSVRDRNDVGAWEFVVAQLAQRSGLLVPPCDARTFASKEHTFMLKRFDRRGPHERVHFASAMTLCGRSDGDDASTGASYLEIAEVISTQGASPREDLSELWSRIVFNVMVSNTDDHLRNHGFLLEPGSGWRLSPAYDLNPVAGSSGLCLNITESDNALDLDLVRSVAPFFRVKDKQATAIVERIGSAVREWRAVADTIGLSRREQSEMGEAFRLSI